MHDLFTPDQTKVYMLDSVLEEHELRLAKQGSSISFHRNGGTQTFSFPEAQQIAHALMALLSGQFDVAQTETYVRLRLQREAHYNSPRSESASVPIPQPELDNL